mmetsp:Transcript_28582/g.34712  ORF Transcript_28582/g.34712 Transcript_28582/m.34712 type:complete len:311 (-) Transcript_28582:990-1922(-)
MKQRTQPWGFIDYWSCHTRCQMILIKELGADRAFKVPQHQKFSNARPSLSSLLCTWHQDQGLNQHPQDGSQCHVASIFYPMITGVCVGILGSESPPPSFESTRGRALGRFFPCLVMGTSSGCSNADGACTLAGAGGGFSNTGSCPLRINTSSSLSFSEEFCKSCLPDPPILLNLLLLLLILPLSAAPRLLTRLLELSRPESLRFRRPEDASLGANGCIPSFEVQSSLARELRRSLARELRRSLAAVEVLVSLEEDRTDTLSSSFLTQFRFLYFRLMGGGVGQLSRGSTGRVWGRPCISVSILPTYLSHFF